MPQIDPMTLMWIQVATGFMGALTLSFLARIAGRRLGILFDMRAYFSPGGGARDALLRVLNRARREILIQAYSFSDETLLNALVEAKKRGVNIEIILDPHHEKMRTNDFTFLTEQGMDPLLDIEPRANPQTIVIDGRVLVMGSYDFTPQAENENAQNLVIVRAWPDFVKLFHDQFAKHKEHAKSMQKKGEDKPRLAA